LVDRCAGRRLAQWLRDEGHDVVESSQRGEDPDDDAILEWAATEGRILITMDKDFGKLVFKKAVAHAGLLRLPDVRVQQRIDLMRRLLEEQTTALTKGAVVTVRGDRVRVSVPGEKS
jgi:predicted nuclease of predicted toxin-antitoxin system